MDTSSQLQKSLLDAIEKTGRGVFLGENLDAMRAYYEIAQHKEASQIDLCYIDPPFNSQRNYHVIYRDSVADKRVAQEGFSDVWSKYNFEEEQQELKKLDLYTTSAAKCQDIEQYLGCVRRIATESHFSYLHFMAVRIWYIWLLLKDTGSFYLHCDPTMSHYLKQLCDLIFGVENFRNEIIWHYTGGGRSKTYFSKKHDCLLFYTKSDQWTFSTDSIRIPYKKSSGYAKAGIRSASGKHYLPHPAGTLPDSVWHIPIINPLSPERKGYPTQKPEALLERIILASSQEGNLVVDFFAGAGTVPRVAERLKRRWLAFDKQAVAIEIIEKDAQANGLRLTRNPPLLRPATHPDILS